jgi:hypothetical protein
MMQSKERARLVAIIAGLLEGIDECWSVDFRNQEVLSAARDTVNEYVNAAATTTVHAVYRSADGELFSDGVERAFGDNRHIEPAPVMACVLPLRCDPNECGLHMFGTIVNKK